MTGTQGTPSIGVVTTIDGVTIEYVEKLPVPTGDIGEIPLTNQDSGWGTETMPGRYKAGKTQLSGIYATGKTGINKLIDWQNDRVIHSFQVAYPNGTNVTFSGYLGTFEIVETSERLTYQIAVSVLGIPTYSNDITALTGAIFTISDGTNPITDIIPDASGNVYAYVVKTGADDTGVKVTPTCGTADSTIYIGAIYTSGGDWEEKAVTSASASNTIPLGSAGSLVKATIRVSTTGKGNAYYFLTFARPKT